MLDEYPSVVHESSRISSQENLASEVKILADFNKVVLTCVLNPMQASRVLTQAASLATLTGVGLANALHNLEVYHENVINIVHTKSQ